MDPQEHTTNKGKTPLGSGSGSPSGPRIGTGSEGPRGSGAMTALAASVKSLASAMDPRNADLPRQHSSVGSSDRLSEGSNSKPRMSSSSTSFQHATRALETMGQSTQSQVSSVASPGGMRGLGGSSSTSTMTPAGGMTMDWDNFLSSSESTIQDDKPHQPSFASYTYTDPTTRTIDPLPLSQLAPTPLSSQSQPSPYQAHLSQPMNLTPANHAAFLEYLKSTAHTTPSSSSASSADISTATATAPSLNQNHFHLPYPTPTSWSSQFTSSSSSRPAISQDIHHQQQLDGGEVLDFLNSTSYTDFVDEIESAGIEKHQHDRRHFQYHAGDVHPRVYSALSLIQHLPSERQDIVSYLLQQRTYTDDIHSHPFMHPLQDESASWTATLAEQAHFQSTAASTPSTRPGEQDVTEQEMERVLTQIVEDAKKEVQSGQTQGKAVDRLLMVRSHITMGTKL